MAETPKEYNDSRMQGFRERKAAADAEDQRVEDVAGRAYISTVATKMGNVTKRIEQKKS